MSSITNCFRRRELLKYLVISKIKLGKKDLMLGYLWWLLDPLLLMAIYWFLIEVILQRGGPQYALFILCGLVPFRALSTTVGQSVVSISSKFSLMNQIAFPRIFLPLADILANHFKLLFGFLVIMAVALIYDIYPGWHSLYLVIPFLLQVLIATGIAFLLAIIGVFVHDIKNVTQFLMRVWLYGSPVLYSIEMVPEGLRDYLYYNPMTPILLMYRDVFMYGKPPSIDNISIALMEGLILLIIGYALFVRYEGRILKAL